MLERVPILSPNYSSRGGAGVRLIVLHTSEGAQSYTSLGSYFQGPVEASSHVGIDDTPGTIGEYVYRDYKAWTQADANPVAVAAELCTPAGAADTWTPDDWASHPNMLANAAAWIAEESAAFGIPIVKLAASYVQSGAGVCQHSDLGAWGGGHHDCGPNFPIDEVLAMAAGATTLAPTPTTGDNMTLTDEDTGGTWVVAEAGAIFAYDGAPYLGGTNNDQMNAAGYPCVGISSYTDRSGAGYTLVLDWGDRGDGHSTDGGDRFRRYRFPRDGSAR